MAWLHFLYLTVAGLGLALMRLLMLKFAPEAAVWGKVATVGGSPQDSPPGFVRNVALSILSKRRFASEGYRRFSKALDRPFALPTTWVPGGRVLVLPPSRIPMLTRPDRTEDGQWTNLQGMLETTQLPYVIDDTDVYRNLIHFDVVRRKMAHKDMNRLAPVTAEEIRHSFNKVWGTDTEWRTVNGWEACGRIISGASQRVLVGLSMSRDEEMLEISRLYANSLLVGGAIINCFPPSIRWLAAPLVAMRTRHLQARYMKLLMPIVEERVRQWESDKEEAGPDDFLQWMLPVCTKEPGQLDATRIALRLVSLLTPLVFAICYVFAHCVLDIHGSPDRKAILAGLEDECQRVSAQHGGQLATAAALDQLHRVDSALRESMRFSDVQVLNIFRDVTAGELDVGQGLHVGPGTRMLFPTQDIHMDHENYAEPRRFDAFRFSRPFEAAEGGGEEAATAQPQELITTPTPTFMPFGYGRHACPGRWFAAQSMKQALAHLVLNYDVELVGPQVKRRALSNIMVPPTGAQIKIRRKSPK